METDTRRSISAQCVIVSKVKNKIYKFQSVSNGTHHSTSSSSKMATASSSEVNDPQLSPNSLRRRSTRVSALKAAEKIKLKDDIVQENQQTIAQNNEESDEEEGEIDESEPSVKRRKLANGYSLDQYGHKFGIKERNGDVYTLTSESEISSLNESEFGTLKANYDKLMNQELNSEQLYERNLLIKKTESDLRMEEAKLTMLRKIKSSQALQEQQAARTTAQNLMLNRSSTGPAAYKPVVAQPLNRNSSTPTTNGKSATNLNVKPNPLLSMAGMTPAQQQELVNRLTQQPQLAQQAIQQLLAHARQGGANATQATCLAQFITQFQEQHLKQQQTEKLKEQQEKAAAALAQQQQASLAAQQTSMNQSSSHGTGSNTPQPPGTGSVNLAVNSAAAQHAKVLAAQSPAQRAAAARAAFRQQADKQLMQLNGPKAPPPDMFFIPNGNQPDFCYLIGLDLVVQRVLKDKQVFAPVSEPCYECEECGTDYTPSWKAIGNSETEMHLYCEKCVHEAQKKKIRNDHTSLLRKAFAKITMQEKDFDKQIEEGKLDAALAAACAQVAQQQAQAQAALSKATGVGSPAQPQNLSNRPNLNSSGSLTSSASTPSLNRTAAPLQNRASGASASSTPKSSQPSTSSGKKPSSSSTNPNNLSMQQLQQLMSMNQALQANPMFNAMFRNATTNPLQMMQMMQQMQMWNNNPILASQMMRQMAATSGSGGTATSNSAATAMASAAALQNMSAMAMMSQAAAAQQASGSNSAAAAAALAAAQASAANTSTTTAKPSTSNSSASSSSGSQNNLQQQQLQALGLR
ncbi:hypothetical protein WR25_10994 isoform B [Diploscapter pachys]|uniref:Transcriptional repressor p66 coiled-coil MBD2-interaction domain-containing protein n=1 Tax=Diploscapter pachys TaxID=2018661 RepID=A0A2A2JF82_9BILA|nr:hypothetical protein WR25_10994 isoform B [Diploscapter pachys]